MSEERSITVLNIDDNDARRYVINRVLQGAGYKPLEADCGVDGLKLARQRPDAIILDVRLPDMNGFEVARQLKADPLTERIPILQISASYIAAADRARGLEAGADAYLTEPLEPAELVATLRSLLRMRAAEQELQASREKLELAQRAGGIGTFEYDVRSNSVLWSKEMEALYGLRPGGYGGSYSEWTERLHPQDRKAAEEAIRSAVESGNEFNAEFRVVWPDGSVRWVAARAQVLKDAEGKPARMIGVNIDVTPRRQAEEVARESYQRLLKAHTAAKIGAYEWDLSTGKIHWSIPLPALAEFSSDRRQERWMQHVHPEDRPRVEASIQTILREKKEQDVEFRMVRADGTMIWLYSSGNALYAANGEPAHIIGIVMDITERKFAEDLLRRTDKLAAAGSLAAAIAHEINNPMEALTNLLYLINENPTLDEQGRRFATQGQEELRRMSHITRQMLAFYRESTRATMVDLNQVVDDVVGIYGPKLKAKGITVEQQIDCHAEVHGFPGELRQVFSNLLGNALEASPNGSTLKVRLRPASDWRTGRHGYRLLLADQGVGISKKNRERIFEPFFTTKGEKGTGLGLWVSMGIIQKHSGSLRFRSRTASGKSGTCFSIFLPGENVVRREESHAPHPDVLASSQHDYIRG